jgi:hypothetical protein
MNQPAMQHELRQSHQILRLYAALLLTTFEGHLKLDPSVIEARTRKIVDFTRLSLNEVLDGIERVVLTAAIIPVLSAREKLCLEIQSIHLPQGVGSSVQSDNVVFAEFIIELLMEHEPERLNLKAQGLCEVLMRVKDMTALPPATITAVVNPVYMKAFERSLREAETTMIAVENRVTELPIKPALRAVGA